MLRYVAVIASLACLAAGALGQTYAQRNIGIRAGVLLIDSQRTNTVPSNYTPHVWFNLDANKLAKPAGWNIYNPRASTQVTPSIQARWTLLVGAPNAPAVGDAIGKRHAAYWEVPLLSAGDQEIADYDVLLLSARGPVALNPTERDKLRRFVDQGGILWVDFTNAATLDPINSFPLPFSKNTVVGGVRAADYLHPLLSYPNTVTESQLLAMETDTGAGITITTTPGTVSQIVGPVDADSVKLYTVATTDRGASISVGRVGDGFVVVTARGVATALNRVVSGNVYDPNTAYRGLTTTSDRSADSAANLIVNMLHLTSGHPQAGGTSRKTHSTVADVWAPLLKRFSTNVPISPGANEPERPPAVHKGVIVVSTFDRVLVYDAHPSRDLDGDGNADDGIQDFALGQFHDLLWQSQVLAGPISGPAVAEVPDAINAPTEQVLVVGTAGQLYSFDLMQLDNNNRIQPLTNAPPDFTTLPPPPVPTSFDPGVPSPGPYAPTVHDGIAYICDSQDQGLSKVGRLWVADLRSHAAGVGIRMASPAGDFVIGGASGTAGTLPDISYSPTVGYIPVADNSGALDRVVYVPTRNVPGSPSPTGAAGISSIWAGVRGETIKPRDVNVTGNILTLTTRASLQGLNIFLAPAGVKHPLGVRVSVVDANGNPWPLATLADGTPNAAFVGTCIQGSPGVLSFPLNPNGQALFANPNHKIVIDYTIDWGQPVVGPVNPAVRGSVNFPDDSTKARRILGQVALSPMGTVFAVHGGGAGGGSLFALREEGRGQFRMVYRYELYEAHQVNLNQTSPVQYRETHVDTDPVQGFSPFINGPFRNIQFRGGPSVRNGTVYVTAGAVKGGFSVPMTILMAFRAEPETAQIRVGGLPNNFSIVQPDMARSNNKAIPEAFSVLQPGQYTYERDPGSDQGTIRIDNMASTTRGPILHSLSTSQPIIIRRSGQPDQLIEPGNTSTRWTPLLWFGVLHGMDSGAAPVVTGETAFMAGSSMLPTILMTNALGPTRGQLSGIDATISPTDQFLNADPLRPWHKQLHMIRLNSGNIDPNPAVRWPQFGGIQSFENWRVRYLQTVMDVGPALGVVAGDGALVAWQPNSLFAFSRSDFLVADEGRLSRFDPSGNVLWSSDSTVNAGTADSNSAGNVKPLVRPTRAYSINANEMVVVDTGGDRVVRIDKSGKETRSITSFKLDPTFRPEGYVANEVPTLRQPRDAMVFTTFENNPATLTNPQPREFWIHYVIADGGNKRLIELIDRYQVDPTTNRILGVVDQDPSAAEDRALGVLYWHSPAAFSGKNYIYTSIARVWNPVTSRYVYAAGIGGAMPTRTDVGLDAPTGTGVREASVGNGGILVLDGASSTVLNQVSIPAIPANVFWNETTASFNSPARTARTRPIGQVNSVTMRVIDSGGGPQLSIMYTDESGVYEIVPGTVSTANVQWMLPNEVYRVMRRSGAPGPQPWLGSPTVSNPMDLRAMYARRLDSGTILIVNGFQGLKRDRTPFAGEIIELNGTPDPAGNTSTDNLDFGFSFNKINFGFRSTSVMFELPPVHNTRGIMIPVFADRR